MGKTILFIIYIAMILAVIFAERKRPTEAVLWVTVMILLPYAGCILYLIFGSTVAIRLTSYARKKRMGGEGVTLVSEESNMENANLSEEDMEVIRFNSVYNNCAITCFDDAEFFTGGMTHYERLFDDIKNAEECIYAEFYTIHNDRAGQDFVRALAEKAEEGVKVYVMCDFIANISTPSKMFRPLREAGGKVIRVKPYLTHYRSHRKIVSIDHRISYIGGMNIGMQYAGFDKVKTPWRDTQIRLTGRCTAVLDEYFLQDWLCAIRRKDWEETCAYIKSVKEPEKKDTENICQFVIGGADTDKESVKMCYLSMIRSAKKVIRIQSPYFVPDSSILDALKTAAASGVKIELMIPGVKASFFLDPVTNYYAGQLLSYGACVYKYSGYIHAKTMVIDDELCCIGSVNMDMRSLMVDDEVCGVFYANPLVRKYSGIFDKDKENCRIYSLNEFNSRGRKEKIAEGVFLLFAPLM